MNQNYTQEMSSNKPYLIRAMYEWINDNECTPHIYIDTDILGVFLPDNLMNATPQILNISPTACQNLVMGNDSLSFQARFSGKVFDVFIPVGAILAILATENGQGLTFDTSTEEIEDDVTDNSPSENPHTETVARKKSTLKIIK